MTPEQQYLKLKDHDVIAHAETVFDSHWSGFTDDQSMMVLANSALHGQRVTAALERMGDVHGRMSFTTYLATLQDAGFRIAHHETFVYTSKYEPNNPRTEKFAVLAHTELGIILHCDSYSYTSTEKGFPEFVEHVNSAQWYACWKSTDDVRADSGWATRRALSSGGWESEQDPDWRSKDREFDEVVPDLFWSGHWDGREGVLSTVKVLSEGGKFYAVWPKQRRPWLPICVSSYDWNGVGYAKAEAAGDRDYIWRINRARFEKMPDWFKAIVGTNELR